MAFKVDNAIIMAAGTSSRFVPLSYEKPKGLTVVKGEVLIERQIKQLRSAGIEQIILIVGYRKEDFSYLEEKFGVTIICSIVVLVCSIFAAADFKEIFKKNSKNETAEAVSE